MLRKTRFKASESHCSWPPRQRRWKLFRRELHASCSHLSDRGALVETRALVPRRGSGQYHWWSATPSIVEPTVGTRRIRRDDIQSECKNTVPQRISELSDVML